MNARPLTLAAANAYVVDHHRHSKPVVGHKFSIGCEVDGALVGVAITGRPVARELDDGWTAEVLRVATDGTRNACSFLYGRARRAAAAMGYRRVITYTRDDETAASVRAAGFVHESKVRGRQWDCPSRPRQEALDVADRDRWVWPAAPPEGGTAQ